MLLFGTESTERKGPLAIEDYLDIIVLTKDVLKDTDHKLFYSLHRQTNKGMGLTERQHALLKNKLLEYSDWLDTKYPYFRDDLDHLRRPYRSIDRSRTITITERETPVFGGIISVTMIAVRFPFSNKMIKHIDFIKSVQDRRIYDNKTKTHYIKLNERNALDIVTHFKDLDFDIDPRLIDYYNDVCHIQDNHLTYSPGVYNFELKNVHQKVIDYSHNKFGEPSVSNLHLYRDAANILGLSHFDSKDVIENEKSLSAMTKSILERTTNLCFASSKEYGLDELLLSINELDRYPLLVTVPMMTKRESSYFYKANGFATTSDKQRDYLIEVVADVTILSKMHTYLQPYVNNDEISVMYRKERKTIEDCDFNNYITRHQLNNLPTEKTKVVFLHQQKRIPKPLLESNWRPRTSLLLKMTLSANKTITIFRESSDLIITYSDEFLTSHPYFVL